MLFGKGSHLWVPFPLGRSNCSPTTHGLGHRYREQPVGHHVAYMWTCIIGHGFVSDSHSWNTREDMGVNLAVPSPPDASTTRRVTHLLNISWQGVYIMHHLWKKNLFFIRSNGDSNQHPPTNGHKLYPLDHNAWVLLVRIFSLDWVAK